ncbi:ATP-binding protein [Uliginosibacterium sp. 31-12]|uniref:ATP-binding protein n=1 Tax=Uliginosibacterium sp. 31-12 TaxID=3062781 RepID=UPI0026E41CA6|nr:ATP-binding protein [Uliginosibacterium sp. 31-12]MDO6386160.1 ATP-binding protein [Uliginosibacterium sp. 31-12]
MTPIRSIRTRLLLIVALVIGLATLAQAIVAYRVALNEVDTISDFYMFEMARAVHRSMPDTSMPDTTQIVPMPPSKSLPANESNCFTLKVRRTENTERPPGTRPEILRHFSQRQDGPQTLRVLEVDVPGAHIEVSHDLAVRAQTARALALRTILPIIISAPLLLLLIAWGTTHTLAPLRRARREIAAREANDLQPLSTACVPEEALPFVNEINVLFTRINAEFRARNEFVADVAHELRSPLAALKLQVQGLLRAQSPEAKALAQERVLAGITRATRLVEQLLVLAREDAARPGHNITTLPQVARLALSDVLTQAQAHQIDLGAELQEQLPEVVFTVRGDAEALRTLLRNLLDNAIKYSPRGGIVTLKLAREATHIALSVEDNGPGIAPEERSVLFERFRRGHSGQDAGGSGLGLAIVRTIATRQEIDIRLDRSETLGGLAVHLTFKPADADA